MKKKFSLASISSKTWMIIIMLFIYLPILYVVIYSFNDSKSLTNLTGFSLKWYEKMFEDRTMLESIYYTVLVAVIATIVSTVIGTITSIGLSKQRKIFKEIVLQINNLPVMNPDIVTAIGLMLFFMSVGIKTSFWTLLLAHITFCIPYVILTIMPKLRTLDDNVAEAALDLGATPWQALTKVIIPQIIPAILSAALIAFSMSFDDFVISFFTTGIGVSNISIYVYSMSKRINPSINALSSIIVLVVTTILILVNVVPMFKKDNETLVLKKRKKWLAPAISGCLVVLVVIVGVFGFKQNKEFDPIKEFGSDTLNIFNAGEYIGEDIISRFEETYNVRVNYDTFASNEEMYTKMLSGASYDVIIPSDYMIEKLISLKMLQPIDKTIVTNLDCLAQGCRNLAFDPDNDYCVPYFWGSVGIVYDTTVIDSEDVETLGWEIFRCEKYKGLTYMYDNERDAFMVAFKALGLSTNTDSEEDIMAAYEWLCEMNNIIDPAYATDEAIDGLIYGEKYMGVQYSGEAAYIIDENENLAFYEPQQGTNIWVDAMCIPTSAKSYILANVFINYILEYENSYENSEYVGYTSSNQEVVEVLSGEDGAYYENNAYLPRQGYEFDESYRDVEYLRKRISELWIKVKLS